MKSEVYVKTLDYKLQQLAQLFISTVDLCSRYTIVPNILLEQRLFEFIKYDHSSDMAFNEFWHESL